MKVKKEKQQIKELNEVGKSRDSANNGDETDMNNSPETSEDEWADAGKKVKEGVEDE